MRRGVEPVEVGINSDLISYTARRMPERKFRDVERKKIKDKNGKLESYNLKNFSI